MEKEHVQSYYEIMDEISIEEAQEKRKFLCAFKYVIANINYPTEYIKEHLRDGTIRHIGYCHVKESSYKSSWYPNHKFYNVVEENVNERVIPHNLMRQDDHNEKTFHTLVWQICDGEDFYNGYLLFPLKDGRYWVVWFEM